MSHHNIATTNLQPPAVRIFEGMMERSGAAQNGCPNSARTSDARIGRTDGRTAGGWPVGRSVGGLWVVVVIAFRCWYIVVCIVTKSIVALVR